MSKEFILSDNPSNYDLNELFFAASKISDVIQLTLEKNANKKKMITKFGDDAFLDSKNLKFPVINPLTGKFDDELIYAAYIEIKKIKDKNLAAKAKTLFDKFKCYKKYRVKVPGNSESIDLIEFLDGKKFFK